MTQDSPEHPDRRPRQPRRQVVRVRAQLRRRLAQALVAAFDRVVRSAVGLKRRTIPALKIALDQPDIVICCKVSLPGITAQRSVSRLRFLESTIALPVAIALQIFHAGGLPVNLATDPSTGSRAIAFQSSANKLLR